MISSQPELRESDATNLYGQETGREHLSASQVSTLLACPQKYGFAYEDKLEPIAFRPALSLGKAFQRAIELADPEAGAQAIRDERSPRDQEEQDQVAAATAPPAWIDRPAHSHRRIAHRLPW